MQRLCPLRRTSTRARTRLGRVAEANYVISGHFGILSASDAEKCANQCSLCIDCRSVLGINPEGIKTVSGIFQEYAERLRNECGFTKLIPRLVRALVDARYYMLAFRSWHCWILVNKSLAVYANKWMFLAYSDAPYHSHASYIMISIDAVHCIHCSCR